MARSASLWHAAPLPVQGWRRRGGSTRPTMRSSHRVSFEIHEKDGGMRGWQNLVLDFSAMSIIALVEFV